MSRGGRRGSHTQKPSASGNSGWSGGQGLDVHAPIWGTQTHAGPVSGNQTTESCASCALASVPQNAATNAAIKPGRRQSFACEHGFCASRWRDLPSDLARKPAYSDIVGRSAVQSPDDRALGPFQSSGGRHSGRRHGRIVSSRLNPSGVTWWRRPYFRAAWRVWNPRRSRYSIRPSRVDSQTWKWGRFACMGCQLTTQGRNRRTRRAVQPARRAC